MTRWEVQGSWGLDRLVLADRDLPGPGRGEVALAVRAVSVNYRDLRMIRGEYDPRLPLPLVPLSDAVAEVREVGEGVTRVSVGDRVCPTFSPTWLDGPPTWDAVRHTRGGAAEGVAAEGLVLPETELVPVPAHLTDPEAATLPCAALTAWSALTLGGITAGDTVLTLGSGGVSVFALQLALLRGARVIATTSSPAKAERLRALGAAQVIDTSADRAWGRTARRWSDGGVDLVVEVGGAGTLAQSLEAARPGGTVASIGMLADGGPGPSLFPVFMKQIRLQGVFVGHRAGFEAMCRAIALHRMRPVVDRVFGFDALAQALDHQASGAHVGKVCLRV